jgi:GrpB-like predicted nucleotidyltransferase (UPF0157 family)
MIGLKRHTVRVVEHNPAWLALGERECQLLREAGRGLILDAQHVGSTAVPGLAAKPILDVAVLVGNADVVPELIARLAPAGYVYRDDHGGHGGHLFIRESEPEVRVAHVHVFARGDRQWDECLIFRDALRDDADLRERYALLKQGLAKKHAADRPYYTAGKEAFIREVLSRFA